MAGELAARVDPPPASPDWLGYPPASDAEVAALEAKLGLRLPPSYAAFLRASNGWRRITSAIGRLRPAGEVDLFRVENEDWVEIYGEDGWDVPDAEYLRATTTGAPPGHRAAHMPHLVQVSDVDDGVLLLNPRAVTPDGEWEAWFFANWVPGAQRYPSFAHLMLGEFQSFRQVQGSTGGWVPPTLPVPAATAKRTAAKKAGKEKAAKGAARDGGRVIAFAGIAGQGGAGAGRVRTLAGRLGRAAGVGPSRGRTWSGRCRTCSVAAMTPAVRSASACRP